MLMCQWESLNGQFGPELGIRQLLCIALKKTMARVMLPLVIKDN